MKNKIKRLVIGLIWILGRFWSYCYSQKTNDIFIFFKINIYSAWIYREFKSVGKGTRISPLMSLSGGKYIVIGEFCSIGKMTVLNAWSKYGDNSYNPEIIIGNNVIIGSESHITAINCIKIGNNVLTGKKITITDNSHGQSTFIDINISPAQRPLISGGPVIIEDGVWIGDKVTILPNVRIGKNSIVGANSVVTKDIPACCIAVGAPAKVIRIIK
ncbi:MAG: acyltransferase [Lutibacter sp.]